LRWLRGKDGMADSSGLVILFSAVLYLTLALLRDHLPESLHVYFFWVPVIIGSLALLRLCLLVIF